MGAHQRITARLLQSRHPQVDLAQRKPGRELSQTFERGTVEVRRLLQAQDQQPHVRLLQDPLARQREERLGVCEEQRLLGTQHQYSRRTGSVRKTRDADEIVRAHTAEHGQARAGQRVQQHRQAEGDRREQSVQHAERHDGGHRGDGHEPIAPPDEVRPEHGQPQRFGHGVNDDRRKDRIGDALDPGQKQQYQDEHRRRRAQAGEPRLRARRLVRRGTRIAGTDRRSMQRRRYDVGRPERNQVAVGLHDVIVLEGVGSDRTVGFGIKDEHQRQREFDQRQPMPADRHREGGKLQGQMDRPRQRDSARGKPRRGSNSRDDDHQHTGNAARPLEQEQAGKGTQPDAETGWLPDADGAKNLDQQRKEIGAVYMQADELRPLLDHDDDCQSERESAQHRPCDQIRHGAQLGAAGEHKCDPSPAHQDGGERDALSRAVGAERECCGRQHGRR